MDEWRYHRATQKKPFCKAQFLEEDEVVDRSIGRKIKSGNGQICLYGGVVDWNLDVSEYGFPSHYHVYFHANAIGKRMIPLINGLNSVTAVFQQKWL